MNDSDRKARVRDYANTSRPAGIFAVRNVQTGRLLVGSTPDLTGMLNRQKFQLTMGSHPDKELQADWRVLGEAAFVFEVLDELDLHGDTTADPTNDLRALKDLWLDKLTESDTPLYPCWIFTNEHIAI